jgi:hypothetical protein
VYLEDGTFVNAELVRLGYAVIATFPPDVRHQELFLELEREARAGGVYGRSQLTVNRPHQARPLQVWRHLRMRPSRQNRATAIRPTQPFVFPLPHPT